MVGLVVPRNRLALVVAGVLNFSASALHLAIVFGGPQWYRFFGAGEEMARMVEQGDLYPAVVTLMLAGVFACWGLYAFSGARVLGRLPFLRAALVLITAIYCARGIYGLVVPWLSEHEYVQGLGLHFWIWSSLICLLFGAVHLAGVKAAWTDLSAKGA